MASKAFTKEDDFEDTEIPAPPPLAGKNYMTPAGYQRMQQELVQLKNKERPEVTQVVSWAAGNGDRSENADYQYGEKRLREIDKRIRFLALRLDAAEVIDPVAVPTKDHVLFGATVTIRNEDDEVKRYSIVGVDEGNISLGRISWQSPLASALLKAQVGDVIQFRSPKRVQEVEIEKIEYIALP